MFPAVIQRGMLSAQAAFSRHSMGKPHSRCSHAFSIIPVPTPAQRSAVYAKSGQFGGGDLRKYLHRSGYQIAGETSPRSTRAAAKPAGAGRRNMVHFSAHRYILGAIEMGNKPSRVPPAGGRVDDPWCPQ